MFGVSGTEGILGPKGERGDLGDGGSVGTGGPKVRISCSEPPIRL